MPARAKRSRRTKSWAILPRWRIVSGDDIAMGPGKADLLDAIRRDGSVAAAARSLGMSYTRAWRLVQAMNDLFASPLVELARGGDVKGGATLTARGDAVLGTYRDMESVSREAVQDHVRELSRHLRR